MKAATKIRALDSRLHRAGIVLSLDEVAQLRRAEKTLQRWAEKECGDSTNWGSSHIERDEQTGKPSMVMRVFRQSSPDVVKTWPIADREAGALKRVAKICAKAGLHYYHQTDPRGCVLYVAREPLTDQTYSTRGVACCD